MSSNLLIPMLILILVFGVLIFLFILKGSRGKSGLKKEVYQTAWLKIENELSRTHPATFTVAVLNADKLFDRALQESGLRGNTFGERLKNARNHFPKPVLDGVWQAHKLRNRIAHEADFHLSYEQAKQALGGFKRGLKHLGAI